MHFKPISLGSVTTLLVLVLLSRKGRMKLATINYWQNELTYRI